MFKKIGLIGIENMNTLDFIFCFLSFFVISFGGILIGLFFSIFVSLATKLVFN